MSHRLVQIVHYRCGEYDASECVLAPMDWPASRVQREVDEVTKEMIADAKALKNPPGGAPPHQPPYVSQPDKTVRQIEKEHAAKLAEYKAWKDENKQLSRSFTDRLRERGLISLWDDDADALSVSAEWGHSHGLNLNYGPRKTDGLEI